MADAVVLTGFVMVIAGITMLWGAGVAWVVAGLALMLVGSRLDRKVK